MADNSNRLHIRNTDNLWSRRNKPTKEDKGLYLHDEEQTDAQKNTEYPACADSVPTKMNRLPRMGMSASEKFSSEFQSYKPIEVTERKIMASSLLVREALWYLESHFSVDEGEQNKLSTSTNFERNQRSFDFIQTFDTKTEHCGNKALSKYITKFLTLVVFRASLHKTIEYLLFGTDIDNIEEFSDICIRYTEENKRTNIFLHTIHKYDRCEHRITFDELWKEEGDFSLFKYFNSYLKIRLKFNLNNPDIMFEEQYEHGITYFILYTTLKDDLDEQKCVDDDKLKKRQTIKNLLSTNKDNFIIFQFKHYERDIDLLTKIILKDRLKSIAKKLIQFTGRYEFRDDVIKMYHLVLERKVVKVTYDICKFRSEFLSSSDEVLVMLREALYEEALKITTYKVDKNEGIRTILFNPNADTISKLIGNVIVYNDHRKRLEIVENKIKYVDPKLREGLTELQVSRTVVRRAMNIAGFDRLNKMCLRLPWGFGKPMFNITFDPKRLECLTEYIKMVIRDSTDKTILIRPDDLEKDIIDDIGKAVGGHLWILDEAGNFLKFNIVNKHLIRSTELEWLLQTLESCIDDLESYRFEINLPGVPKLTLDVDAYDKGLAKDFLNNLWFFTDQANENEIDEIAKKEIIGQVSFSVK